MPIGCLALARPTFDVPFAEAMAALGELRTAGADRLLLLQVTFPNASMTVEVANAFPAPLPIWAFPEPRAAGRLQSRRLWRAEPTPAPGSRR